MMQEWLMLQILWGTAGVPIDARSDTQSTQRSGGWARDLIERGEEVHSMSRGPSPVTSPRSRSGSSR